MGVDFVEHGLRAVERLLPHLECPKWTEGEWAESKCVWTSAKKTEVRLTVSIGNSDEVGARSLTAYIKRRKLPGSGGSARDIIDSREHSICSLVAARISGVLEHRVAGADDWASMQAIQAAFDESIVAAHVQKHHDLNLPLASVLRDLHTLSEQSYENKALTFGCILDPGKKGIAGAANFPTDFLESKKYRALSDGFRTAYWVSRDGTLADFVDLDRQGYEALTEKHYFPEWAEPIARSSRQGRCGIALSRQGDILIFDEGTLRFTYRYGRWQYWNHAHLVKLLRDRARAQHVPQRKLGRVVGSIYRAAIDISFRRSGGLFLILHNRHSRSEVVKSSDTLFNASRSQVDIEFDSVFEDRAIQSLPRSVTVELASLDGSVVLENSGRIVAYGAILQPRRGGKLRGTEGSRTKAAVGASNYGLAIKISSDGDMSVYFNGEEFIRV